MIVTLSYNKDGFCTFWFEKRIASVFVGLKDTSHYLDQVDNMSKSSFKMPSISLTFDAEHAREVSSAKSLEILNRLSDIEWFKNSDCLGCTKNLFKNRIFHHELNKLNHYNRNRKSNPLIDFRCG